MRHHAPGLRRPHFVSALALTVLAALPAAAAVQPVTKPPDTGRKAFHLPYVQGGTPTRMTVMWRSPVAVAGRLVVKDADNRQLLELKSAVGTEHVFRLSNLRPGTQYRYSAHEGTGFVGEGEFKTNMAADGKKFRFIVMGDSGSGSLNQVSVAKKITAWKPDFVLHTGDVIYEKGEFEGYGPRFMEPYKQLVANTVMYPTPGNHDYGLGNLAGYTRFFEVPRDRPEDQEKWYTFTYGNAQFFSLDTNQPFDRGTPQYQWLEAQLKASKCPWKFAYTHYPPYSSGEHGSSMYLRRAWSPLFERYNVQVVFTGHDHHYERSKPREDFVRDGVPTTYVVTGGAGAWLRTVRPQAFTAVTSAAYHFVAVTMDDRTMNVEVFDKTGVTLDRFKVIR